MAEGSPPTHRPPRNADHLANERTFLAWIRTSIAMMGLGFVVARFGVWLRELAARLNEPASARHGGLSLPMGIGMISIGAVLALLAGWRYRQVRRAIDRDEPAADAGAIILVTVLTLITAIALSIYMVLASR